MENLFNETFQIQGIFPVPVVRNNIQKDFTEEEKSIFDYHSQNTYLNAGNTTSSERYVLKDDKLKNIKNFIDSGIDYYVKNIIIPKHGPLEFYVTQSWLNFTKPNQFHHKHEHPNSIISGVFYIDADVEKDKIFFYKENSYKQISFPTDNYNWWNSPSWYFEVKTGDLLLFPSNLTHMVENKVGENVRCSLAFNVFAKGYFGDEESMTALHV